MLYRALAALAAVAITPALSGCGGESDGSCDDEVLCAGAPSILQVFVRERLIDGTTAWRLAFGTHPAAEPDDDGSVVAAVPERAEIHVILDQPVAPSSFSAGDGLDAAAVRVLCEGDAMTLDGPASSYRSVVNQSVDSAVELPHGLGPALVLAVESLRTTAECELRLPGVRDHEGLGVTNDAAPFFYTDELRLLTTQPADAATEVPVDSDVIVRFNAPIAPDQAARIELLDAGQDVSTGLAPVDGDPFAVRVLPPADGLAPATSYRVRAAAGLEEVHGGALPADESFRFSTSPVTGAR